MGRRSKSESRSRSRSKSRSKSKERKSRSKSKERQSRSKSPKEKKSRSRSKDRKTRSRSKDRRSRSRGRNRRSRSGSSTSRGTYSRSPSPMDLEGYRVHVADLGIDCTKRQLEDVFKKYGPVMEIWMAQNPPCFAFVVYRNKEDAEEAIAAVNGQTVGGCRVRCSYALPRSRNRRRMRSFDPNLRCYQCGERGHFSRDCDEIWRYRGQGRRGGYINTFRRSFSRSRSRSPGHRRVSRVARSRTRSRSRDRERRRSHRSRSRSRSRSKSKSKKSSHKDKKKDKKKDKDKDKEKSKDKDKDKERERKSSTSATTPPWRQTFADVGGSSTSEPAQSSLPLTAMEHDDE